MGLDSGPMAHSPSEPRFVVLHDDETISYKEGRLIRAIRNGDLTGDELFRRDHEPDAAMRPLHESRLFQHVHGVDAVGAARVVDVNKVRNFSRHLTVFLGVGLVLTVMGIGIPFAFFWALWIAFKFSKVAPSFARLYAERGDTGLPAALGVLYGLGERATPGVPAPVEDREEQPEPLKDVMKARRAGSTPIQPRRSVRLEPAEPPLHLDLRAELERFGPLLSTMDPASVEALEATRTALDDLFARRRELGLHLEGEDADGLLREAAELETELADPSLDSRTREALEQTLDAVQQRQEAIADARQVDGLLRARARSVLHQLKSLRLSLVSSSGTADDALEAGPLGDVVEALRHDMAGTAELEEALAEARHAPKARAAQRRRQ